MTSDKRYAPNLHLAFGDDMTEKHATLISRQLTTAEDAIAEAIDHLKMLRNDLDTARTSNDEQTIRTSLDRVLCAVNQAGASGPAPSKVAKAYAALGVALGVATALDA